MALCPFAQGWEGSQVEFHPAKILLFPCGSLSPLQPLLPALFAGRLNQSISLGPPA